MIVTGVLVVLALGCAVLSAVFAGGGWLLALACLLVVAAFASAYPRTHHRNRR